VRTNKYGLHYYGARDDSDARYWAAVSFGAILSHIISFNKEYYIRYKNIHFLS